MALRTLRVFISSPGDVAEERVIARRVIGRLDAQFGDALHVEPVFWEHAPLVATASFQEQLARPSEADIAIVILWGRLGTALPSHIRRADGSAYASGTEFEFEDARAGFERAGRPRILTYRKTAPVAMPSEIAAAEDALRQRQSMDRFVARWFHDARDGSLTGAFHNFRSPAEFEDLLEAHLTRLLEDELPSGARSAARTASWRGSSPFRGLEAFQPEHAPVFFGRTAAVADVLGRLRRGALAGKAFVLVVGMSGGGKSSLARAGVLPLMLQPEVLETEGAWRQLAWRPSTAGGSLVASLLRGIAAATGAADARPHDDVAASAAAVVAGLDAHGANTQLALVVDQLEEAFSDERIAAAERAAFFALLDALARCGRVWVVATMRSDAYPRLAESPLLVALKEGDGQFDLLPPTLREIGQIIRFPALAAGLRFETRAQTAERLDDVIRDAAAKNPGALPLLQFLLEELYVRRSVDDVLTFRAYEDLGGVEGALARRAETVFAACSAEAQAALPAVLRELMTVGIDDDSRPLRRIAPRAAFASPGAAELTEALLAARLLVASLGADGSAAVSLAHEALLEFWPRVRAWRDENRELLVIHGRVSASARVWEQEGRSGDLLLARGKPLAEARQLAAAGVRLSPAERTLIDASERKARRFAVLRGGAVAGLAVLSVVAGVAAWRADAESKRARVQATTAQRTTDFMVSLFTVADPGESTGETVTVREVLDRGVAQIGSQLQDEQQVGATLLGAMGQAYNGLGLYPRARAVLEDAVKQSAADPDPNGRLKIELLLAENRYLDGDYDAAETIFRASLADARRRSGRANPSVARALRGLGETLAEKNEPAQAEPLLREALALDLQLYTENHVETARTLDALGRLTFFARRYAEADAYYNRSLAIQTAISGPNSASVAFALNNLAALYSQVGRYAEAGEIWAKALPAYRSLFGDDHRNVALVLNNLGRIELLGGKTDAAQAHLEAALAIYRKRLAPGHDDFITTLNSLAAIDLARGDAAGAAPLLQEAEDIARARKHWMLGQVLINEAELACSAGRIEDARRSLVEAEAALRGLYGDALSTSDAWRVAILHVTSARLEAATGHPVAAKALLADALPVLTARFGAGGFYTSLARERMRQIDRQAAPATVPRSSP